MLSWAPEILLQLEKIWDAFSAATHRIPFPKLSECSISSMQPEQQNSFLSIKWERIQDKNHYPPNYGLGFSGFFLQKKQCLSSIPWTEEQMITAHQSHLADAKGLVCLTYLSKPPWIPWARSWLPLQDPGLAGNTNSGIFSF